MSMKIIECDNCGMPLQVSGDIPIYDKEDLVEILNSMPKGSAQFEACKLDMIKELRRKV